MLGSHPGSSHEADLGTGGRSDPGPPAAQRGDGAWPAARAPGQRWCRALAFQLAALAGLGPDPLLQRGRILL